MPIVGLFPPACLQIKVGWLSRLAIDALYFLEFILSNNTFSVSDYYGSIVFNLNDCSLKDLV